MSPTTRRILGWGGWPIVVLVAIWAGHLVQNRAWLAADHHPLQHDFGAHFNRAQKSAFFLAHSDEVLVKKPEGLRDGLAALVRDHPIGGRVAVAPIAGVLAFTQQLHVSGSYPPLVYLVVAPVLAVRGADDDAAVLTLDAVFLAVLLAALYLLGRQASGPWTGVLAAFLAGCYPWLGGLIRRLVLDVPLASMVALSVAALGSADRFRSRRGSLLFGAAVGLATLTKQIAPLFVFGPTSIVLFDLWRRRRDPADRPRRLHLALAVAVAFCLCAGYYVPRAHKVVTHFFEIEGGGEHEKDFLRSDPAAYAYYGIALVEQAGGGGVVVFLVALPFFLSRPREGRLGIALWLLLPYVFFSLFGNKDHRFTVPFLPAVALVSAVGLTAIPWRVVRAVAVAAAVVGCGVLFVHSSWALPVDALRVRHTELYRHPVIGRTLDLHLPINTEFRPDRRDWRVDRILALLEGEGRPVGKVRVRTVSMIPEVTHTLATGQEVPELEYRYGIGPGFYDVDDDWYKEGGTPEFLLVADRFHGIVGTEDFYRGNLELWREHRDRYRLLGEVDLPEGLTLGVYALGEE